jgi:hypothetical protein
MRFQDQTKMVKRMRLISSKYVKSHFFFPLRLFRLAKSHVVYWLVYLQLTSFVTRELENFSRSVLYEANTLPTLLHSSIIFYHLSQI